MNIIIQQGKPPVIKCAVDNIHAIPQAVFGASQHFGGGTYTAVVDGEQDGFENGEKLFRMTTEWVEG